MAEEIKLVLTWSNTGGGPHYGSRQTKVLEGGNQWA